jgi:hypothetical protein
MINFRRAEFSRILTPDVSSAMNKEKALKRIADAIARCPLCRKGGTGKAVPGEGNPDARVVFIGEAPGNEEARSGRPFIGRSGMFLRQMIKETGLNTIPLLLDLFGRHRVCFIIVQVFLIPIPLSRSAGVPNRWGISPQRLHFFGRDR